LPAPDADVHRPEQGGIDSGKIYFHDIGQAHTLLQLFLLGSRFHSYRQFQADCQTGRGRPILSSNRNIPLAPVSEHPDDCKR
jgi:hypothetical protein